MKNIQKVFFSFAALSLLGTSISYASSDIQYTTFDSQNINGLEIRYLTEFERPWNDCTNFVS